MASRSNRPDFNRRKLLGLLGMGGAVGIAGCIGDDDDDETPTPTPGPGDTPTPTPTPTPVPPDEIVHGGTLRYALGETIDSFDPPYSLDTTSSEAQGPLLEGLTTTLSNGEVLPWLAKSVEFEVQDTSIDDYVDYMIPEEDAEASGDQFIWTAMQDGMVMTTVTAGDAVDDGVWGMEFVYELHEGVRFHNGDEMTSEDVVASYERYEWSMVDDQVYDDVMHVRANGDYEVRVYLAYPDPEGIRNAGMTVMHRDQARLPDNHLDPREGNIPIGTGPFVFTEFEEGSHYIVDRNDDYWLDEKGLDALEWYDGPADFPTGPVIDRIDADIIPSNPTRTAALMNDELDMCNVPPDVLDDFDASPDFTVVTTSAGGFDYMQFPVLHEPWDDERVRSAVNHLIPREIIADEIFAGWRDPAWSPLPELARGTGTQDEEALEALTRPRNEFDPEAADDLMQDFVDDTGFDVPIEVTVEVGPADNDQRVSLCELIVEMMNDSGWFDASLEAYEWGAYLGLILGGDYHERGHIYYVGLSAGFNPASYVEANHDPLAIGGCCNANAVEWDDLTEIFREASSGMQAMEDPHYRAGLYDECWDIITERNGTVYTVFSTNTMAMHQRVRGYQFHPTVTAALTYGIHQPADQVVTWIDPDA